jgi:hypothetical protein
VILANNKPDLTTREGVKVPMSYTCQFCDTESESAHTITIYDTEGIEERLDILCDTCYADWLLSLKG